MAEKKLKKHEKILKEIQRLEKADETYLEINGCPRTSYMDGKYLVYQKLKKFINNL